jgi:hypothetical protein
MKRLLIGFVLFTTACSGGSVPSAPSSVPTVIPTGPSVAIVTIRKFIMIDVGDGSYAPQVEIAETSGLSGATLTDVALGRTGHPAAGTGFLPPKRYLSAGGSLNVFEIVHGDYPVASGSRSDTIVISFVDDGGRAGSVRGTVSE